MKKTTTKKPQTEFVKIGSRVAGYVLGVVGQWHLRQLEGENRFQAFREIETVQNGERTYQTIESFEMVAARAQAERVIILLNKEETLAKIRKEAKGSSRG